MGDIQMKQVSIIGAGLAGLSAGIYARQSGFDVTIYESHTIPGGASTIQLSDTGTSAKSAGETRSRG